MEPAIYESLDSLNGIMSDEASKMVTRVLMRNAYGGSVYAGLFGRTLPHHVILNARQTVKQVESQELQIATGIDVPPYAPLGDVIRALDPERSKKVDEWLIESLTDEYLSFPTLIDGRGSAALDDFFSDIKEHVVDMGGWKRHDTMVVALILYSYQDFELPLMDYYGSRVAQGIVPALHRYRIKQKSSPVDICGRNFNMALILHAMHHLTRRK